MATSGQTTFTLTPNEFVEEILEVMQASGDGESVGGTLNKKVYRAMNLFLKQMETDGGHLWTQTEGTLFLQKGQAEYDFATAKVTNTYYETITTAASSSGSAVVSVTDADNMTVADEMGVLLTDGSIQWSTIASISSLEITMDDVLTQDTLAGGKVYNFNDALDSVSRIIDVRRKEETNYEIPINFDSRDNYMDLPNKSETGMPIQAYYSRQRVNGIMYVWPAAIDAKSVLNFTYERQLDIVENTTQELDIPNYWFNAFIWGVAKMLITRIGVSPALAAEIRANADIYMNEALSYDNPVYPIEMYMERY